MSSLDDFCLKWNEHHTIFFSNAEQLCATNALCDVTLSCGNKEFAAHKLVLAVCSGYFANLFTKGSAVNTRAQPGQTVVYLKDVDPRHLELILQYMYRGEINVQEDDLMDLLNTAKGLKIKGLTEASDDNKPKNAPAAAARGKKRVINVTPSTAEPAKRVKEEFAGMSTDTSSLVTREPAKVAGPSSAEIQFADDYEPEFDHGHDDEDYGDAEDLASMNRGSDCSYCGGYFSQRSAMLRHVRTVHSQIKPLQCWYCDYKANRNELLKSHCMRRHQMTDDEYMEKYKIWKIEHQVKKGRKSKEVGETKKVKKEDTSKIEKEDTSEIEKEGTSKIGKEDTSKIEKEDKGKIGKEDTSKTEKEDKGKIGKEDKSKIRKEDKSKIGKAKKEIE